MDEAEPDDLPAPVLVTGSLKLNKGLVARADSGVKCIANLEKLASSDGLSEFRVPRCAFEVLPTVGYANVGPVVAGPPASGSPLTRCSAVLAAAVPEAGAVPSLPDIPKLSDGPRLLY